MSPRQSRSSTSFALVGTFLLLLSASSVGCTALTPKGSLAFLTGASTEAEQPPANTCKVEFHRHGRIVKSMDLPVTEATRIQDIVTESKAASKYGHMKVEIVRQTNNPRHPVVKLPCRYDHKKEQISWDTDYGIHPGDYVVFSESDQNSVDEFMTSLVGPVFGRF